MSSGFGCFGLHRDADPDDDDNDTAPPNTNHTHNSHTTQRRSGYFYWAINIGALISFSLVASIAQFGVPWLGGKDYRFVVGFAIPALATAMVRVIVMWLCGDGPTHPFTTHQSLC